MQPLWKTSVSRAVELRHTLHQHPELAWEERQTAVFIRQELDALGIEWTPCAGTGSVATLARTASGRTVALRADMDGLPIVETSGVRWQSLCTGKMHACGHDGHSATLLGVARWLKANEARLPGPVRLLFQPAEEGGHGAKRMIEEGAVAGVDVIFGWHNWPAIAEGQAVCPDGPVMCANGAFSIDVLGLGGHSSQPELCRDPVLAAAAVTVALQQIVSRRSQPQAPCVVSVTSILAESGVTTIPDRAKVAGSLRASSNEQRQRMEQDISDIARATCTAYGTEAKVTHAPRYGATINHAGPAAEMREVLAAELRPDWKSDVAVPIMASEDFSYYLREIPGAFALIGAGQTGGSLPCHNAGYDFNDTLIDSVGRIYARLAGCPVP